MTWGITLHTCNHTHNMKKEKNKDKTSKAHVSQPIAGYLHPNLVQCMWKVDNYPKGQQ